MTWKFVGASVQGTSHRARCVDCQDICICRCEEHGGQEIFWAVVADGAGSADMSETGAEATSTSIANKIGRWLGRHEGQVNLVTNDVVIEWVTTAQNALVSISKSKERQVCDYACTVLGIVCGAKNAVAFQIGDGAIVAATDVDHYETVCWPENGEYANSTYFITDSNALEHLQVRFLNTPHKLALMTDGLHHLALHFATHSVHTPFFEPMFNRLISEKQEFSELLTQQLKDFLDSKPVNQRTDDDKTLVLAVKAL